MIANFFIDMLTGLLTGLVGYLPNASALFLLPIQVIVDNASLAFGYIPLIENVPILVFALTTVITLETAEIGWKIGHFVYRKLRSG